MVLLEDASVEAFLTHPHDLAFADNVRARTDNTRFPEPVTVTGSAAGAAQRERHRLRTGP